MSEDSTSDDATSPASLEDLFSDEAVEAEERRRPRRRRRAWAGVGVAVVLVALVVGAGVAAFQLYDRAMTTRTHLEAAMAEVQVMQDAVLGQDQDAAAAASARMTAATAAAVTSSHGRIWSMGEIVPWLGPNLSAVRQVAEVADDLAQDVVAPAATLDLSALAPTDGRIDLAAVQDLSTLVDRVGEGVDDAAATVGGIPADGLIDQVASGVVRLDDALQHLQGILAPTRDILGILPAALGADGPRDYLAMFQGNSEARSLGGNAGVFIVIHVEDGAITLTQHVDSSDFAQPLAEPVVPLDGEAVAIYGDKIGRYTPDFTMVPDFPTATGILDGWWQKDIGTDVDAYISLDPVALSYLLAATGPVSLPTGDTLTADNAVPLLLNEVYFRYEDPLMQNAFFGAAAASVFTALTDGSASPIGVVSALARAADEGRLLYASDDPVETALIGTSRMSGRMPGDADGDSAIGVFVNDNTASKKSYYLDMGISVVCEADTRTRASVTLSSSLDAAEAARLPYYIAGPYFAKGDISSYVVLYGPAGSTLSDVEIDGASVTPLAAGTHLGRPAVKVEVLSQGVAEHMVTATFDSAEPRTGSLRVWHTPMTRATSVDASSCTDPTDEG